MCPIKFYKTFNCNLIKFNPLIKVVKSLMETLIVRIVKCMAMLCSLNMLRCTAELKPATYKLGYSHTNTHNWN